MRRLRFGWCINKIVFFVALLIPLALNAQWTNTGGGGGSASFADSARAASIADSAKHAPGVGQSQELMADRLVTYTTNADTFSVYAGLNVYPLGKAFHTDGGAQYAYVGDVDALDMDMDDFLLSVMTFIWPDSFISMPTKATPTDPLQGYWTDAYTTIIRFGVGDGANTATAWVNRPDAGWHLICFLLDKGAYSYIFIDDKYRSREDVSAVTGSLSNASEFRIGRNRTSTYSYAYYGESMVFRFGQDGLYVTGTGGTDLEIRVGDASGTLIYSEKYPYSPDHPGGLIPDMYKNPGRRLSALGYGELENAVRTELHDGAGSVSGMVVGDWYYFKQGAAGHDLTVGSNTYTSSTVFQASATTGTISNGDANDSVKRIGEVAYWPMNESGTPTTLYDATDNNLDLTTVGSPQMVYTTWDKLSMDHIYADTLEADSANVRVINAARHYVTNGDVPGTGSTTPMLYANGGEIYAHDAAGNNTLISPHFGGDWVFNSFNSETGVRTFIDMIDLVKAMEALTGKKFMYSDTLLAPATIEEAADTVYVVVVDTVKHTRTLVQYLRPRRGYRLIGGKAYRFLRDKAHRPPDGWYKRHGMTPPGSGKVWRQP